MARRLLVRLATLVAIAWAALPVVADGAGPLIVLVRHATQELIDDGTLRPVLVPVEFAAGVDPKSVSIHVQEVVHAGRLDLRLIQAFTPSIDAAGSSLVLRVDYALVNSPGAYEVRLELTRRAPGDKASVRQPIVVTLTHPSAKLRGPGTIVITRTVRFIGPPEIVPAHITVFEESKRSRAALRFESASAPIHDGNPVAATVDFGPVPASGPDGNPLPASSGSGPVTVAPGGAIHVEPKLEGRFPVGSTKASMLMRSDQIDDPVTFDVEIRSRYPGWLVFPLVLVSAMLGWLLRVYLKQAEDWWALADQGEMLVTLLKDEADLALPEQRKPLDDAANALRGALDRKDEKTVTAGIAAGNALLADAEAARKKWRTETVAALTQDRTILDAAWQLPVSANLKSLQSTLEKAIEDALDDNVKATNEARGQVRREWAAILTSGRVWSTGARQALSEAEAAVQGTIDTKDRDSPDAARRALTAAAELDPASPPATDVLLRTLHTARARMTDYATDITWRLSLLARDVARGLDARTADEPVLASVQVPGDPKTDPVAVTKAVPEAVTRLKKALHEAIIALKLDLNDVEKQQLQVLLEDSKLVEAATFAGRKVRGSAASIASTTERETADEERRPEQSAAAPSTESARVIVLAGRYARAGVRQARARRHLTTTRFLRGAAAALIAAIAATLLYHETFTGTAAEMLGLGAVAFMSDFTFESALDAVLKKRQI